MSKMSKATIYTTTYCSYCQAAKQLLTDHNIEFEEVTLDDKPQLRTEISEANGGWRTVPMITIDDKFIGGYQELSQYLDKNEIRSQP